MRHRVVLVDIGEPPRRACAHSHAAKLFAQGEERPSVVHSKQRIWHIVERIELDASAQQGQIRAETYEVGAIARPGLREEEDMAIDMEDLLTTVSSFHINCILLSGKREEHRLKRP